MLKLILVVAICGAAGTGVAHAQTIEQSYADQCSSGQKSETCDLLRKALLDKLQSQQAMSARDEVNAAPRPSRPESAAPELTAAQKAQWGVIGEMAGALWADAEGNIMSYQWVKPGKRLKIEMEMPTGEKSIGYMTPDPAQPGTLKWNVQMARGIFPWGRLTVFPDGTAHWKPGKVVWQMVAPGRIDSTKGKVKRDGTYTKRGDPIGKIRRISPAEYRELLARRDARLRQQAASEAREDDSGLVGALVGAAVGAYAGSAAGLDASATTDLMVQGAAMASSGSPIGRGLAKGWSEGTASNEAMQQTMDNAIDRGLAEGAAEYDRREAEHSGDAGVVQQSTQADAGKPATAASEAAVKPLRFVLLIGMRNLPGDRNNSMCYSNVITRPGPPGWGAPGFLPSGSAEQALGEINALKGEFIAACRRSGREITSEGNFSHVLNQQEGDEQRMRATQPRFAEDVSVVLN